LVRIGLLVVMMLLNAGPAWAEAHTRRSNLDVVAVFLADNASAGDLIVVQDAWEGITFNRYYRGQAQWMGSYLSWWNQQVTTLLLDHAQHEKAEAIAAPGPVNHFEHVSVVRFTGYKPGTE
jgi:hypothetical protein